MEPKAALFSVYDRWILLASLFAGFTTFTKLEGTGYLFCQTLIFFLFLFKQKKPKTLFIKNMLLFLCPSYFICIFYHIYKFLIGATQLNQKFIIPTSLEFWHRTANTFFKFAENLFFSGNWNMVWIIFVISLWQVKKYKNNSQATAMVGVVLLYFSLYFMVAILSPNETSITGEYSSTVLSRIILHFYPLATAAIILINAPISSIENHTNKH